MAHPMCSFPFPRNIDLKNPERDHEETKHDRAKVETAIPRGRRRREKHDKNHQSADDDTENNNRNQQRKWCHHLTRHKISGREPGKS